MNTGCVKPLITSLNTILDGSKMGAASAGTPPMTLSSAIKEMTETENR
jgi:hypothetical protein